MKGLNYGKVLGILHGDSLAGDLIKVLRSKEEKKVHVTIEVLGNPS